MHASSQKQGGDKHHTVLQARISAAWHWLKYKISKNVMYYCQQSNMRRAIYSQAKSQQQMQGGQLELKPRPVQTSAKAKPWNHSKSALHVTCHHQPILGRDTSWAETKVSAMQGGSRRLSDGTQQAAQAAQGQAHTTHHTNVTPERYATIARFATGSDWRGVNLRPACQVLQSLKRFRWYLVGSATDAGERHFVVIGRCSRRLAVMRT